MPRWDGQAALQKFTVLVDARAPHSRDGHRRERLVDLPQRDVRWFEPGAVEHLADDASAAQSRVTGRDLRRRPRP